MIRGWKTCWLGLLLLLLGEGAGVAAEGAAGVKGGVAYGRLQPPTWLPHYDLGIRLDVDGHLVTVTERVTWINRHLLPTREVIFNAHAHYAIPDKDIGLLAKTLEMLRMAPSESMSFGGPPLEMKKATLLGLATRSASKNALPAPLSYRYAEDNDTALVVSLPEAVGPGESVTVELEFVMKLPPKKGRWGQWGGVTTLAQWLPVLAYFDDKGWQPTPFIPWHLPFFNEASVYAARMVLPADQKLACSAVIRETKDLGNGWQQVETEPQCLRDFAVISSARFEEHLGEADGVRIRCLALPEHAYHGEKCVQICREAIPVYNRWFGRYPGTQFTVVESYFGWNGNQCGGLVMIDTRMMDMPHMATAYLDYLLSHELCHQWWYNAVGTNGYAETWMSEGLATYFSHRIMDRKVGRNNKIISYPTGLSWLPNIGREDFRNYGYLGVMARGQAGPTVQDMPKFKHLVNLMGMTYDRGSKVVGMIEQRLGEDAFLDFMRRVYSKYYFQILRVKDFQRELEEYTGQSWQPFFQDWLYGAKNTDWAIAKVEVGRGGDSLSLPLSLSPPLPFSPSPNGVHVKVWVQQRGEVNEPTVLGIRLKGRQGYQVRVPIRDVSEPVEFAEVSASLHPEGMAEVGLPGFAKSVRSYRIDITLPSEPDQISIDPDHLLLDSNPTNNHWHAEIRWRVTPLYTQLEEVDVTNAYDRWNVIIGPWMYANAYNDPWFVRSPILGAKAGLYRNQDIDVGPFVGYRTNDSTIIAGGEFYWDHVPLPNMQVGVIYEKELLTLGSTPDPIDRGAAYLRYVLTYGSSLYLPPFEYVEAFVTGGNRSLPLPHVQPANTDLFDSQTALGVHYHKMYLTPYWDPEGGVAVDASYQYGFPIFGNDRAFQQLYGQMSTVKYLPEWFTQLSNGPVMSYLKDTRFAFRAAGAAALPNDGLFFTLGGGNYFRGYDLAQRQGSMLWLGSIEWRLPVAKDLDWDFVDHVAGVRNLYVVPFYDIGDVYVNNQAQGSVAHAVGVGLRADVSWLGLIERTMLRFDVAKCVNDATPFQFWVGIAHPF